jgi:hypothetical protein
VGRRGRHGLALWSSSLSDSKDHLKASCDRKIMMQVSVYAAVLIVAGILGACNATNSNVVYREAVLKVKCGPDKDGYWVGDVAQLYRLGTISKEVAEADAAPLSPLIDRPRPFHGYLLRAMESGPAEDADWSPTPIKGANHSRATFGICVYPAGDDWKGLPVFLVCPRGVFSKMSDGNKPILAWPKEIRSLSSGWAIID